MTTPFVTRARRAGVTLVELLVVMAIITALGLLALMLLPGITNSDAALKGTEEVRAQVKIAQALAGAARQPRGVRFLTGPTGATVATELQLLEAPQVAALDPLALSVSTGTSDAAAGQAKFATPPTATASPYVELVYDLTDGTEPDPNSTAVPPPPLPAGIIKLRHCYIRRLSAAQRADVRTGALLSLPTLGAWSRIVADIGRQVNGTAFADAEEVELDVYPDAAMGAATHFRTYHAGIYGTPVPLLGQPTTPLPKDIGVDLDVSSPRLRDLQPGLAANAPVPFPPVVTYDIMFAPDGQTIGVGQRTSNAGVYLWVRDVTKVTNPTGANTRSMLRADFAPAPPAASAAYLDAFRRGGEHHAVGINNGAVGTAPILWPDATGLYPAGTDWFTNARRKLN